MTTQEPERTGAGWLVVCAMVLELAFAALHLARSPAEQVLLAMIASGVGGIAWVVVVVRLGRAGRAATRTEVVLVLVAGLVFRLTLLPLDNATSPDVDRYLWEGVVQAEGFDPYRLPPDAPELRPVAEAYPALAAAVNRPEIHPHIPAIYPPVAQALFRVNAELFGGALWGWKLILLAFDAALILGLAATLRARSLPAAALAAVAWCPLLLIEAYEAAHLDLVGVSLVVLAAVAMDRRRWLAAGVLLGLAANVKYLWPALTAVLLLPAAWRQRRGIAFAATAAITAAGCWIPFRAGLAAAWETSRLFAESWAFNDVVFETLRRHAGEPRWMPMAIVLVTLFALAGVLVARRRRDTWSDLWLLNGTALLLGPVAYPWYFVWAVPGLLIRPPAWLMVWVLTLPMLHIVDWQQAAHGRWDAVPWLFEGILVVPLALLLRAWWLRLRPAAPELSAEV